MLQTYQGSCHCGCVTFELDAILTQVIDCNCSLCRIRGALWHGATQQQLRVVKGESELELYQFNTKTAKHYFCRHCGIHPFCRPRLDPNRWAVNVRCLEGVDLSSLKVLQFDGQHWEDAAEAFRESRARGATKPDH